MKPSLNPSSYCSSLVFRLRNTVAAGRLSANLSRIMKKQGGGGGKRKEGGERKKGKDRGREGQREREIKRQPRKHTTLNVVQNYM